MSTRATTVFISHASSDSGFARRLFRALQRRGVRSWMDESTQPRAEVETKLEAGSRSAGIVLLVLSDRSVGSPNVNFEMGAAIAGGKPIIPIFLSEKARRESSGILRNDRGIRAVGESPARVADRVVDAIHQLRLAS